MLDIRPLSKDLEEAAKKTINEDPDRREKDVEYIREWIGTQPHLNARTDDQFLITFLRGCKFSLERTKEKLDAYYTYRSAIPEFFRNRDPLLPKLQELFDKGIQLSLGIGSNGHHVWLMKISDIDPDKNKAEDIVKAIFMVFEIIFLESDHAAIFGQKLIINTSDVTIAHVAQWTPPIVKKSLSVLQNGYPCRVAGLHYVNVPGIFEALLNLVRLFAKEKLKDRILVSADFDSLAEYGMKNILPSDCGGCNETTEKIKISMKKKVESYRDYFLEEDKYGVDESRRPGKSINQSELLGVEGSFRQLKVD